MDLYLLSSTYGRVDLVDQFESFIWTERAASHGDFQIIVQPSRKMKLAFYLGRCITHSDTDRVMIVESILEATDATGAKKMTVKGRSFESILDTRALSAHTFEGDLTWKASGTAGAIACLMVSKTCVTGTGLTDNDIIPQLYVNDGSGTTEEMTVAVKPQSLYTSVKELCDSEGLSFRIQLTKDSPPRLRFNVYRGELRPNVAFSTTLDNLAEESHLKANTEHRNIAYVWAKDAMAMEIVAAPGYTIHVYGVDRRVMHVDATDIDPTGLTDAQLRQLLRRRGREALSSKKLSNLFDGVLTAINPFKYRVDYHLGDIVSFVDDEGVKHRVAVTEYIWSYDGTGLKSYPTFAAI